eukprot:383448_1
MGGLRGGSDGGGRKGLELMRRLPHLQNLVRRDPSGYRTEFMSQLRNCKSEMEIVRLNPVNAEGHRFLELLSFVSHCIACYVKEKETFPNDVVKLIDEKGEALSSEIRVKLVQSIILMRNRGLLAPLYTIKLAFRLFRLPDKALRHVLHDYIVNDIKSLRTSSQAHKLDKELKAHLYRMLSESSGGTEEPALVRHNSLMVIVELYRRRVWIDERTVNIIASVLTSQDVKLVGMGLRFFLNIDQDMDGDEDDERGGVDDNPINYHSHAKKRSATLRKVKKQIKARNKSNKANDKTKDNPLFPAMSLLHNPQGYADKMLSRLKNSREKFELKLLMMNFISRVIATHKLLLLPFYSYMQRYVQSHQKEVTLVLTYLVQASHDQVPPDELLPVVKAILYNFVTERCPGEVIAVGINTIREVIRRCPSLLNEDGVDDLVRELVAYIKYKDKSVIVASRGFLNLIRQVYPKLLQGKDRGKNHDPSARPLLFGEQHVADGVEGADLLTLIQEGVLEIPSDNEICQEEDDEQLSLNSNSTDIEDEDAPPLLVPSTEAEALSSIAEDSEATEMFHHEDEEGNKDILLHEEGQFDDMASEGSGVSLSEIHVDPKRRVDAMRSLSAEDFKKIKKLRTRAKHMKMGPMAPWKINRDEDDHSDSGGSESDSDDMDDCSIVVNPECLQSTVTRKRKTAEEKRAKVEAGRIAFQHRSHGGGLTNLEKQRRKNYLMVRKGQTKKGPRNGSNLQRGKQKNSKQQFKRDKRKKRRT